MSVARSARSLASVVSVVHAVRTNYRWPDDGPRFTERLGRYHHLNRYACGSCSGKFAGNFAGKAGVHSQRQSSLRRVEAESRTGLADSDTPAGDA
jgi:hypothetical protein